MSHSPSREGFAVGAVSLHPVSWVGVRGPCRAERPELPPMHLENRESLELGCQLRTAFSQPAAYRRRGSVS